MLRFQQPVYPTEDSEKVIKAISSLFTDIEIEKEAIETTTADQRQEFLLLSFFQGKEELTFCKPFMGSFAEKKL